MAAVCSECGGSLAGKKPGTKTDTTACRQKRSRRLARQKKEASAASRLPPHQLEVSQSIYPSGGRREVVDTAHRLLEEELRPVVREAITEDALRAIQKMVGLTTRVVELLADDLESEDSNVRQKAYTLISKYTLGHQAIVTPESAGAGQQLVVNFALPRPEHPVSETQELELPPVDSTAEETQACETCSEQRPLSQFVANSQRCQECYDRLQREVQERFGTDGV